MQSKRDLWQRELHLQRWIYWKWKILSSEISFGGYKSTKNIWKNNDVYDDYYNNKYYYDHYDNNYNENREKNE